MEIINVISDVPESSSTKLFVNEESQTSADYTNYYFNEKLKLANKRLDKEM